MVVAPIIVRQIGGTVYPVYGYFSPEARETAGEKIGRLLTRSAEKKNAWKPWLNSDKELNHLSTVS